MRRGRGRRQHAGAGELELAASNKRKPPHSPSARVVQVQVRVRGYLLSFVSIVLGSWQKQDVAVAGDEVAAEWAAARKCVAKPPAARHQKQRQVCFRCLLPQLEPVGLISCK